MSKTFATSDMYGTYVYGIVQHRPDCFSVTCLGYTPHVPLTPEEQAEAEAEAATYAKYEAEFGDGPMPASYYTTANAAQRATELNDALHCTSQDLAAFNAPSECYPDAMNSLTCELNELEEQYGTYLCKARPKNNPYTERGVEDRSLTIAQSLGLPDGARPDDHDIYRMLGERQAL